MGMPLNHAVESELGLCGLLGWHLVDEGGQSFKRGLTFLQARNETLADEPRDEGLEFQLGDINSKLAVDLTFHCPQIFQGP